MTKAIWIPGKERSAWRLVIQTPLPTKPHHRNHAENTKPSDSLPIGQTAEGLNYRFFWRTETVTISDACKGLEMTLNPASPSF
jgi:hypothetical protein